MGGIMRQSFTFLRSYYEAIKDAHENGYEFFDLFGTVGDPNTNYKNLICNQLSKS